MKPRFSNQTNHALTLIEVLVVIAILAVLVVLLLPALAGAKKKAQLITCNGELKEIGLSFKIWEGDHTNLFPMSVSTNFGGTMEYASNGETFRHFQVMSNELSTPKILVCPTDVRAAAKDFGSTFSNTNISYFVSMDADDSRPEMLLSGDRNIVGGIKLADGILEITTNQPITWSSEMHDGIANVGLADGSVIQLGRGRHIDWPEWEVQIFATNRLAIP
jgi:prepilin-type N-terminal cleavage/methylation domain-containing protein